MWTNALVGTLYCVSISISTDHRQASQQSRRASYRHWRLRRPCLVILGLTVNYDPSGPALNQSSRNQSDDDAGPPVGYRSRAAHRPRRQFIRASSPLRVPLPPVVSVASFCMRRAQLQRFAGYRTLPVGSDRKHGPERSDAAVRDVPQSTGKRRSLTAPDNRNCARLCRHRPRGILSALLTRVLSRSPVNPIMRS